MNMARMSKETEVFNDLEPYELTQQQKVYLKIKRGLDIVLGGLAVIVLSPIMGGLAVAVKLDSPGPILFKQKRIGKEKKIFEIWKFRTMRIDTPRDIPTHMLDNPECYITRTGRLMRKLSLDELPQLIQCVMGRMSLIGPRPALWNQDDLVNERDKYGANNITPGITGWAQINGRDELEISEKARLDGEYVKNLGFVMDIKCFLGTIGSVLCSDGVIEGGIGELQKENIVSNRENSRNTRLKNEIVVGIYVIVCSSIIGIGILTYIMKYKKK